MDLEELFESMDADTIEGFVRDKEQENLHLDFKTVVSPELRHSDDKKNFAKALSGFANANGGILVWGVGTEKNAEGLDCATTLEQIDRVPVLLSKLETNTGQWVDPQVMGVRHRVIFTDETADKGYALSFIPESEGGPHMSLQEYRYYTRSGDSFYKMTHSQVADRFFRKRVPRLEFYTSFSSDLRIVNVHGNEYVDFELIVGIKNVGKGIAKYPYLSIKIHEPYGVSSGGLDGNSHVGLTKLPRGNYFDAIRWGAGVEPVVHPGGILEVTKVRPFQAYPRVHVGKDLVIEYEICAEDAETVKGTETIKYSDMEEMARAKLQTE